MITGIVVTYNTADYFKRAYESVRKFLPDMKIIIVDGSDKNNPCYGYTQSLADDNTRVFHTGHNIGHGKGINTGIGHVQTPYAMIFDSDIEMLKSPVAEMLAMMEDDTYGIGCIQKTDTGGFIYGERPDAKESMRYLQPYFCLIQMKEYKKYPPFIHHGAPAVSAMLAIHKKGISEKVVKEFPVADYIKHDFYGTRGVRVAKNQPEIEDEWDKVIKPNSITCITCTGDRIVAFDLCARWMQDQTIIPSQWIVVDDGKIPTTPKINCEYVRREPQRNDPLHTMTMNLKLALSKVTGDKIIIWEDDDYYSPKYIEEMSKKLDEYDLVGIGKSKYYNIQAFRYYQHNGEAFKDHASLAQTAFKKSLIPLILKKMNGDQFLDVRIWQGLRGNSNIFVDDKESLYVGIKGMPGRKGIGSGHNPNMEGYKDDKNKAVLRAWIQEKKHLEQYLNLKTEGKERSVSVRTYKAIQNGGYIPANSAYKSSVYGRINPGTVFEYEGPVGMWMSPIDEPEKKMVPVEDLPIYVKAKEISESKGLPSLEQTPLDSKPKLKGKRR